MWEQIRELTLKSIAPAKIYEEGDLIKRSIRDLYNRDIDEVFVEGERGYRIAKDFMKMIMPSHAKNVKRYEETLPLFARYQVEAYLAGMFNPTVQLPSGGYIVIDTTEALVAVDVNSGRATKEGSIEQTALKTNMEAAAEVARQLRLRDLAGLIVIDFIDMDERRNNASVEKLIKDKLKTDRARIQIGRISGFGLMEMSRQRLRPGMIEATTQPCHACHGTGLIRSDDNLALSILRTIEEEGTCRRSREVLIKAPVGIANFLMNQKREHIAHIEARYGLSVRIEGDPYLVSPDFSMEKFKTATRVVNPSAHIVSVDTSLMDKIDEADAAEAEAAEAAALAEDDAATTTQSAGDTAQQGEDGEAKPKRKRRRRRRSRGGRSENDENQSEENQSGEATAEAPKQDAETAAPTEGSEEEVKPKSRSRSRSRKPKEAAADVEVSSEAAVASDAVTETVEQPAGDVSAVEEKPKPKRTRAPRKPKAAPVVEAEVTTEVEAVADAPAEEEKPKPKRVRAPRKPKAAPVAEAAEVEAAPVVEAAPEPVKEVAPEPVATPEPTPVVETAPEPVAEPEAKAEEPAKPRRKGWWSLGR